MTESSAHNEWRRWIEDQAPKLLLFARLKARNAADAEDLMQEALVECWQRNDGQTLPPLPLVFATIHRRAIDWARREDRRTGREQVVAADETQALFDTGVEDREIGHILQTALAALPAEQREVVTLKVWGELTFAEIAEALDIPPNTAASRYRYGMEALRKTTKLVLT